MRPFDVAGKVDNSGEYILGSRETGSHACYLIYGILKPGEQGRKLSPGAGHEEIVLALSHDLTCTGHFSGMLKKGQALHLKGEEAIVLGNGNNEQALYVISGGHSEQDHHH
jgi:hypothetical protein